jgi:hypothetical protein
MLQDIFPFMVSFTGVDMERRVIGAGLAQDPYAAEIVLCVHDEANFECHDGVKESWCLPGHGTAKSKNRGQSRMLSAYACPPIGIFRDSLKALDVGNGIWWTGAQFITQVAEFLAEFDRKLPGKIACAIYDNSSNHGCDPVDALRVDKPGFNKFAGAKHVPIMREGFYHRVLEDGTVERVPQSMFFRDGDTVLYPIGNQSLVRPKKTELGNGATTTMYYESGFRIVADPVTHAHELIGVVKGVVQVCLERKLVFECRGLTACACEQASFVTRALKTKKDTIAAFQECKHMKTSNPQKYSETSQALLSLPNAATVAYEAGCILCNCATCVLGRERDFMEQRSGIEEAFIQYNAAHDTNHRCLFLPKFHPELNFIERIWGRMKYYIRINCDNTFPTLKLNIEAAMEPFNLPLAMIRR